MVLLIQTFILLYYLVSGIPSNFASNSEQHWSEIENSFSTLKNALSALKTDTGVYLELENSAQSSMSHQLKTMEKRLAVIESMLGMMDKMPLDIENDDEAILDEVFFIQLHKIVEEAYARREENFDTIVHFATSLKSPDLCYYILSSLYWEMRYNNHSNPFKLMTLVDTLQIHVINQKTVPHEIKAAAKLLSIDIIDEIKDVATGSLRVAMLFYKYQNNRQVHQLADAIDDFRPEVSDEVMQRVVAKAFFYIPAVKIAEMLFTHNRASQIVSGLAVLFHKLQNNGDPSNDAVRLIGNYLKHLRQTPEYHYLSKRKRRIVEIIIEELPNCTKLPFPIPTICVWKKNNKVYVSYSWFEENLVQKPDKNIPLANSADNEVAEESRNSAVNLTR